MASGLEASDKHDLKTLPCFVARLGPRPPRRGGSGGGKQAHKDGIKHLLGLCISRSLGGFFLQDRGKKRHSK